MHLSRLALFAASVLVIHCGDDDPPDPPPTEDCPAPTAGPTEHSGDITADETWAAEGGPHRVTNNLTIRGGATVTIEPCVTVEVSADTRIWVGNLDETATLVAEGSERQPILFTSAGMGRWDNLRIEAPAEAHLAWVTLEEAGADGITYDGATMVAWGTNSRPVIPTLRVQNVTVRDSSGFGVIVNRLTEFLPGSANLTITGAGADHPDHKHPINIQAQALGSLPTGSYTGNSIDEILVDPRGDIESDATMHNVGVPHHIDGVGTTGLFVNRDFDNAALPVPTLTVEAGVTVLFDAGAELRIGTDTVNHLAPGALMVNGTATEPVTFTSSAPTPAAGDWRGIVFKEPPGNATNSIDYARIEYAGDGCSCGGWSCPATEGLGGTMLPEDAALLIYSWEPASVFVTNTTISDSAGWGILRGWDGAELDFTANNTFTNLAYCPQSWPAASGGNCPTDPYVCTP